MYSLYLSFLIAGIYILIIPYLIEFIVSCFDRIGDKHNEIIIISYLVPIVG